MELVNGEKNEKPAVTPAQEEKIDPKTVEGFITIKGKTLGEIAGVLNMMRDGGRKTVAVLQVVPTMSALTGQGIEALVQSEINHCYVEVSKKADQ